jgi:hypothetical protein
MPGSSLRGGDNSRCRIDSNLLCEGFNTDADSSNLCLAAFWKISKPRLWGSQFDIEVARAGTRVVEDNPAGLGGVRNKLYQGMHSANLYAIAVLPNRIYYLSQPQRLALRRIDVDEGGVIRRDIFYVPADQLSG